jgi:hypothetical protein
MLDSSLIVLGYICPQALDASASECGTRISENEKYIC